LERNGTDPFESSGDTEKNNGKPQSEDLYVKYKSGRFLQKANVLLLIRSAPDNSQGNIFNHVTLSSSAMYW
jgi:hypothetical protein